MKLLDDLGTASLVLASLPILTLLLCAGGLRLSASRSAVITVTLTALVAFLGFGATPALAAIAVAKAALLTLYIACIIWPALALYHVMHFSGAIVSLGRVVKRMSDSRDTQALLLGWVFSSLIQGVTGFGIPVAIVAPVLVSTGVPARAAVAAAAVGHAWAVSFGDIGVPLRVLLAVTGSSASEVSMGAATLLGIACVLCGYSVVHICGGNRALRTSSLIVLSVGVLMAGVHLAVAQTEAWPLASLASSASGLALLGCLVSARRAVRRDGGPRPASASQLWEPRAAVALLGYGIVIGLALLTQMIARSAPVITEVVLAVWFAEIQSLKGFLTPGEYGQIIPILIHPGWAVLTAAALTALVHRMYGHITAADTRAVVSATARMGIPVTTCLLMMVFVAMLMGHTGMSAVLAAGIGRAAGAAYPLFAPFLGALGAALTGSNTTSNVVFGPLQLQAAHASATRVGMVLAAQTAGGSLGGMVAPAKVAIGCATTGASQEEGSVVRTVLPYFAVIMLVIAILAWGLS